MELRVEQPSVGRVDVFRGATVIASFDLPQQLDDELVNLFVDVDIVLVHDKNTHEELNP
jgi:hypothetical protein|tara:strand:- start:298 stop:474 length:177 start_codon:yes stop_codon:yes gene_type:complete